MNRDERKKKMEEQLSEIRKKGAAVEEALQNQKRRGEFSKMVEEERQKQKERKFASPKTPDEAEGKMPSRDIVFKSKKEILDEGTLLQKMRLYISYLDTDNYFGYSYSFTNRDQAKLLASIETAEDRELTIKCIKEYKTLSRFGEKLRFYFKRFQTSFSLLAVLLNRWESYEEIARTQTDAYHSFKNNRMWLFVTDPKEREKALSLFAESTERKPLEGAKLIFNKERGYFSVDVDRKGGLYSQIKAEAEETAESLRDFKAYAVVAEEFIKNSTLKYMPISIQMSIENAEQERYVRFLVSNLRYFRSDLAQRREKGETITAEDERRAVIPDYYEVEPSPDVYEDCREGIKNL